MMTQVNCVQCLDIRNWRARWRTFCKSFFWLCKSRVWVIRDWLPCFVAVLQSHQKEKLTDDLADTVDLICFDSGLNGNALGMTDRTIHNRLKELISKEFLKPKLPNQCWVNPTLFSKGDRVTFMKEYRLEKTVKQTNADKERTDDLTRNQLD